MKTCSNKTCTNQHQTEFQTCPSCREKSRKYSLAWSRKNKNRPKTEQTRLQQRESSKRYRERNRAVVNAAARAYSLRKKRITVEDVERLWRYQQGRCFLCGIEMVRGVKGPRTMTIDHDHQTGLTRALLCNNCNRALGLFRDNREVLLKAAAYVGETREGVLVT